VRGQRPECEEYCVRLPGVGARGGHCGVFCSLYSATVGAKHLESQDRDCWERASGETQAGLSGSDPGLGPHPGMQGPLFVCDGGVGLLQEEHVTGLGLGRWIPGLAVCVGNLQI
jgi:hypothetical protein